MTDIEKELEDVVGGTPCLEQKAIELCGHDIPEDVEIYYEYSFLGVKRSFGGKIVAAKQNDSGDWEFLVFMNTDSDYTGWYPREAVEGHVYPSAEAVMNAKITK